MRPRARGEHSGGSKVRVDHDRRVETVIGGGGGGSSTMGSGFIAHRQSNHNSKTPSRKAINAGAQLLAARDSDRVLENPARVAVCGVGEHPCAALLV
jgi:hypothetical protein